MDIVKFGATEFNSVKYNSAVKYNSEILCRSIYRYALILNMSYLRYINGSIKPVFTWGNTVPGDKMLGLVWGKKRGILYDPLTGDFIISSHVQDMQKREFRLGDLAVKSVETQEIKLRGLKVRENGGKAGDVLTNRDGQIAFETTVKETSGVVSVRDEQFHLRNTESSGNYYILRGVKKVLVDPPKIDGYVYRIYVAEADSPIELEFKGCRVNYSDWKDSSHGSASFLIIAPHGFIDLLGVDGDWVTTKMYGMAGL